MIVTQGLALLPGGACVFNRTAVPDAAAGRSAHHGINVTHEQHAAALAAAGALWLRGSCGGCPLLVILVVLCCETGGKADEANIQLGRDRHVGSEKYVCWLTSCDCLRACRSGARV